MVTSPRLLAFILASAFGLAGAASAATPEQAERAQACNLPDGVIETSLEKEPLIARIKEELLHGGHG